MGKFYSGTYSAKSTVETESRYIHSKVSAAKRFAKLDGKHELFLAKKRFKNGQQSLDLTDYSDCHSPSCQGIWASFGHPNPQKITL